MKTIVSECKALAILLLLCAAAMASAQNSTLQFFPGTIATVTGTGTAGTALTQVNSPRGMTTDSAGNLYVADYGNARILKITKTGVVTVFAGTGTGGFAGDGGLATAAQLHSPVDVAFDSAGNLYIADFSNNRIRMVTPAGIISTVAGSSTTTGFGGDGGLATSALLNAPWGVALDSANNLYIADSGNNRIREVNASTKNIATIAGTGTASFTGDGGLATAATLNGSRGVVVDPSGNIYIADYSNHRIRKITNGTITTVVGTGSTAYNGEGLAGTSTNLYYPAGVALDAAGSLYFSNTNNYRVQRFSNGVVNTVAGISTNLYNGDGIPANTAGMLYPFKVTVDASGNIFIGDGNSRVREVVAAAASLAFGNQGNGTTSAAKSVTLINTGATSVSITGIVASASFSLQTTGSTSCAVGNLASGQSCTIVVTFSPATLGAITGTVTVSDNGTTQVIQLTGTGTLAPSTTTIALVPNPIALAANTTATVQVTTSSTVTAIPTGTVSLATGTTSLGTATLSGGSATLQFGSALNPGTYPVIATYSGDTNFLPSTSAAAPLAVNGLPTAITLTFATTSPQVSLPDLFTVTVTHATGATAPSGTVSFYDGTKLLAAIALPSSGVATYSATLTYGAHPISAVYSGDSLFNPSSTPTTLLQVGPGPVASITPAVITTIAGGSSVAGGPPTGYSGDGGPATAAALGGPYDVAVDISGNVYIADSVNNRIRKITNGTITTFAGTGTAGYSGDGGPATSAKIYTPRGLATDAYGNVYFSDYRNGVIREINTSGIVTTVAGNYAAGLGYSGDGGAATNAQLNNVWGVLVDVAGNLYIADTSNNVVRFVNTSGIISTIAGNHAAGAGSTGDGGPGTSATLNGPARLALDASGNLYIADVGGNRIRLLNTSGTISTFAGTGTASFSGDGGPAASATLNGPYGLGFDAAGDLYIADRGNFAIRMVSPAGIISTIGGIGGSQGYSGDGSGATYAKTIFPYGLAVDSQENVYFSDTSSLDLTSAVRKLTVSAGAINFGTLIVGADQPIPLLGSLTNTGATNLTLIAMSASGAGFSLLSGTPNGCTATTVLAPAASCAFSIGYVYSTTGTASGTLQFTDNSGNVSNSVQTVSLMAITVLPQPTVALTITPSTFAAPGAQVSFAATVTPGLINPGAPTGIVTFSSNGTTLGTAPVNASGVATFSTSALPLGTYTVIATYSGDTHYQPVVSASQTFTITYDFAFSITPTSADLKVAYPVGGTVTITPAVGQTTPIVLSCGNLPYGYSCTFTNSTLTSDGSGSIMTTAFSLSYTTPTPLASLAHRGATLCGLLLLSCALLGRRRKLIRLLVLLFLILPGSLFFTGCGSGANSIINATYPISVTATAGVVVHSATITVHLQ